MDLSRRESDVPVNPMSPTKKRKRSESPDLSRRAKRVSVEPSNESVNKPVKKRSIFTSVASMAETSVKPKTETLSGVDHPKSMYGSYCWDALPSPNPCINPAFWNSPLALQGRGVTPTLSMSSSPGISDQSSLDLRMRSRDLGCSPVMSTQHKSNSRTTHDSETSFPRDCTPHARGTTTLINPVHATGTSTFFSPPHATGTTTCPSPITSRFPLYSTTSRCLSDSTHSLNIPQVQCGTNLNTNLPGRFTDYKHTLSHSVISPVHLTNQHHSLNVKGISSSQSSLTVSQPYIQKHQVS